MTRHHLSKTRYMYGLQCERRLWLACHRSDLSTPFDAGKQAILDQGSDVGEAAHRLFPGGVLVDAPYDQFGAASAQTQALLADDSVPALFEAAFDHGGVRVRVDVLEKLGDGAFGLREVKSSTQLKKEHLEDVAVQHWVLDGCGLSMTSAELVCIDTDYVRGPDGIDWSALFARHELMPDVMGVHPDVAWEVGRFHALLGKDQEPGIEPSPHCKQPWSCDFWEHCTAGRSREWFLALRRAPAARRTIQLEALRSGSPWVAPDLGDGLRPLEGPLWYLDFETVSPAIPLWEGTRPYQQLPFQWSLHRQDFDAGMTHREFLADGRDDPRRATAETLIAALSDDTARIVVYSDFERTQLKALAAALPDLAQSLHAIRDRLVDLLPIVRNHVYHPDFAGSYSLKVVAPSLIPGFSYDDLAAGDSPIAEGGAAATAFRRLAEGKLTPDEERATRHALLAYCERDTLALVQTHAALRTLATAPVRGRRE